MSDETLLTPEERLQELSDIILSNVVNNDAESKEKRQYLFGQLPVRAFRDENYILYKIMFQFKDKGITPDSSFLKMYLMRHTKLFNDSSQFIDLSAYTDLDENPYVGYTSAVINQYTRLSGMDKQGMDDFKLSIEKYKVEYSAVEMDKAYSQARVILHDGVQIGRRYYQGFDDSYAFVKHSASDIENLLDSSLGDGFIDAETEAIMDNEQRQPEKIGDFDLIDELNAPESLGGVFSSLLYNVVAPTKGGKSKFTARMVHTAMVKYGTNCSVWAFEGGYEAWWAQLRAIHFEYLYIRQASSSGEKIMPLSQKDIMLGNYPNDSVRSLEEASRIDLFTNPNYGKINMINRPFYVETFIEEIDTSVKINSSKMVLIDYLQLISSSEKGKKNNEIIKEAYKKALQYCKDRNVAIVTPAQFTQEFIKEMAHSKDGKAPETRTSGGESSEVIRASDINIALYASIDDLQNRSMTIMSIPSRLSVAFPAFEIYADLCSCVFSSISDD